MGQFTVFLRCKYWHPPAPGWNSIQTHESEKKMKQKTEESSYAPKTKLTGCWLLRDKQRQNWLNGEEKHWRARLWQPGRASTTAWHGCRGGYLRAEWTKEVTTEILLRAKTAMKAVKKTMKTAKKPENMFTLKAHGCWPFNQAFMIFQKL